jgi:pimeloyl-ACP methyl ester carboxylesterase
MLSNKEQTYISEHYASWKPGKFRYWQSLPQNIPGVSFEQVEKSKQKPALIFIHGYGAMIEHWRHNFEGLKGQYRLYAIDLLGFGFSQKSPGSKVKYSADLWAKQVRNFLLFKGEEKAIIVGHSVGGMVATHFAYNYPQMVEALVLVDAAGVPDQVEIEKEALQRQRQGKRGIDFGELLFSAINKPLIGEMAALALGVSSEWAIRSSLKQAYWDSAKVTDQLVEQFSAPLRSPGGALSYLAVTRDLQSYRLPVKPGDLTMPTLVIWGQHDRSMPVDLMLPRWQALIPQAETFVVEDAAHCPQDERPDQFNSRLIQFVEQIITADQKELELAL